MARGRSVLTTASRSPAHPADQRTRLDASNRTPAARPLRSCAARSGDARIPGKALGVKTTNHRQAMGARPTAPASLGSWTTSARTARPTGQRRLPRRVRVPADRDHRRQVSRTACSRADRGLVLRVHRCSLLARLRSTTSPRPSAVMGMTALAPCCVAPGRPLAPIWALNGSSTPLAARTSQLTVTAAGNRDRAAADGFGSARS